jgi:hypothetical protein
MEVKACAVWINIKNNKIVLSIAASIFFAVANSVSAAYGQTQEKKCAPQQQQQPSPANLGPFDAKLQYYPPNLTQTADFRPIIINPEPDRNQSCKRSHLCSIPKTIKNVTATTTPTPTTSISPATSKPISPSSPKPITPPPSSESPPPEMPIPGLFP